MKASLNRQGTLVISLIALSGVLAGCGDGTAACEETRTCVVPDETDDSDDETDTGLGGGKDTGSKDDGDGDQSSSSGDGDDSSTSGDGDEPSKCADGTWDHDEDPETKCKSWSSCAPGQYVSEEGSATSDRDCSSCAEGTFSEDDDVEECDAWTECPSGVVEAGTSTSDVACASPAVDVAVGGGFSCVLREDGGVECWGKNDMGQLGNGSTQDSGLPQPVLVDSQNGLVPLTGVVQLSAGWEFACALRDNGTVWCWGANDAGQLGTGTYEDGAFQTWADPIDEINSVTKIVAGGRHACALLEDKTARCWGLDGIGFQLGGGLQPKGPIVTVANSASDRSAFPNIVDIAAGGQQTCSVLGDGSMRCWGLDPDSGGAPELGLNASSPVPTVLPYPSDKAARVDAGLGITCWSLENGQVECQGAAPIGAEGTSSYRPREIVLPSSELDGDGNDIKQVAVDGFTRCILFESGNVWCWGENEDGQLGDGSTEDSIDLVQVQGLQNIVAMDAGYSHACAIDDEGRVHCWGKNENGELGNNTIFQSSKPVRDPNVEGAVAITSGSNHNCAVLSNGKVKCWGSNDLGQLGIGEGTSMSAPIQLGLSEVVQVASKYDFTYATRSDGTLRVWGSDGNENFSFEVLEAVEDPHDVVSVATGMSHACAVTSNAEFLTCWGANVFGALGHDSSEPGTYPPLGDTDAYFEPFLLEDVMNVTQVAGGYAHTCAIMDGLVSCWGLNNDGEVGPNGSTSNSNPFLVPGLSDIARIAAGKNFSIALAEEGTIWAWGANALGQLGNGTLVGSSAPSEVQGIGRAVEIAAGHFHSCAITTEGTVSCWGQNNAGQIGLAASEAETTAVDVAGVTDVAAISAGAEHTCALHQDGTVSCWGSNASYQLGHIRVEQSSVPSEVIWQ